MLLQQLLHSLHVEHVIVVHLFLGGLRALGQRDGAAHCRDRGHRSGEGPWLHTADSGPLPSSWALTHSGDGSGEGHQAQDLAEMRPRPQKMQGEMARNFLKVMLPGVRGKSLNSEDVILPKGVHRHQRGTGKVGRQEKRAGQISGSRRVPTFLPNRFPLPEAI